ncbi:hypothetical protein EDD86DRAFT_187525 [Gorgonomyces haynaldii]|nr:hypothetical protein EDD86DRAFT_187525 [Gorgonomyces haynaldii]
MLFTKQYSRKTKKGNIIKVIKEHYLRDDIYCGTNCSICPSHKSNLTEPQLEYDGQKVYVVPDTNILFHEIDLMEHDLIQNVIVLQTVLEEVRHKSSSIYQRIRRMVNQEDKHWYVFSNEHHQDTFIEKKEQETINDRNDAMIRKACEWYLSHGQRVLLVTNDVKNRELCQQDNIPALGLRQYLHLYKSPQLQDLASSHDEALEEAEKFKYPPHLSKIQLSAGLKSGAFLQGTISISQHNFLAGQVLLNDQANVHVIGRVNLNRATHGDVVVIQMLPKSEWKTSFAEKAQEDEQEEEEEALDDGDAEPCAKVVGIIKRSWRPLCGTVDTSNLQTTSTSTQLQTLFFWPMDKKLPKIRIRTRQAQQLRGKRIICAIDQWSQDSKYPSGHFVRVLGDVGDKQTETQVLLLEFDVPFAPFSPLVLSNLPAEGEQWIVKEEHLAGRRDFRGLNVCSIDPPGCTDIDDALHCRVLDNGNLEIGVHIADVSYFVKPETPMDLEAQRRGTTVYLVDKRIDMLPSLLGTNLCSLRSNVDRLAFSCLWEMTPNADIVSVDFTKSVIRSKNSFTYDEAQARIDDPKQVDPISTGIRNLNKIAKILRKRRLEQGALTLASPEVRFRMEDDSQDPVDVELKELKESNALVEEFMLLANIHVAKRILDKFPESSMLRRHPKPPTTNFDGLKKALEKRGFHLDTSTSKTLSDSLDKCVNPKDPYFNKLVRIMTTRCMMQAVYFSSGTMSQQEYWHYGLATPIYTHFTSPIRRYADLQVHRLLYCCISNEYSPGLADSRKVAEMAQVLNYRNRQAQQAARSSVELYTNLFFKDKKTVEDGYVLRILKNGVIVLVPKFGLESVVFLESPEWQAGTDAMVCPETNQRLELFSHVQVQLQVVDAGGQARRSKLLMELVNDRKRPKLSK